MTKEKTQQKTAQPDRIASKETETGKAREPSSMEEGGAKRPPQRRKVAGRGGRSRRRSGGRERFKPEFDQKIIDIRRVTRVVAGGRRFSFRVTVVAGNKKGKVGVGVGKGSDTALAIEKAAKNAKKHMVEVKINENMSIAHNVHAKYGSSQVHLLPAPGKGLVAGSSVRNILDLAGITDVTAKLSSRSKNKLNNARAALAALSNLG